MQDNLSPAARVETIPFVAERMGVSRATVYRLMKSGDFVPLVRLSPRRVGFLTEDVDAWLASRRDAATNPDRQTH